MPLRFSLQKRGETLKERRAKHRSFMLLTVATECLSSPDGLPAVVVPKLKLSSKRACLCLASGADGGHADDKGVLGAVESIFVCIPCVTFACDAQPSKTCVAPREAQPHHLAAWAQALDVAGIEQPRERAWRALMHHRQLPDQGWKVRYSRLSLSQ